MLNDYVSNDIKVFDEKIKELIPELEKRKEAYKGKKLSEKEYPYIFIYAEDYKKCFDEMAQETSNYLGNIANLSKDLNVIIIISISPNNLSALASSAYSLDLSFTEQTKAMPKNAAYVKNGSDFAFIKVVQGD